MTLPADSHVHSEWSWDTGGPHSSAAGTMERTCARARKIGLGTLTFTEHLDFDGWQVGDVEIPAEQRSLVTPEGVLQPPPLDVDGYLESIDRCRHAFPELEIRTGVEFGQPHRFDDQAARLLDLSQLDLVLGSLRTLQVGKESFEPFTLFRMWPAERVIWDYLAEVPRMVAGSDTFAVFTHLDYAVREWPTPQAGPFDPRAFEDGFRQALRAIAASGRALELNVSGRLRPWLVQWWVEEGGRTLTFGSDAHDGETLANAFPEAAALAEHVGFRPGRRPGDVWTR